MADMTVTASLSGAASVGEVLPGWRVTEEATPVSIGNVSGECGALAFAAAATTESVYAANKTCTFAAEPGSWTGRVLSAAVGNPNVSVEAVGALGFLNGVRTAEPTGNFAIPSPSIGTQGSSDGALLNPSDVVFDSSGNMFVADAGNYRIQKFTQDADGVWQYVAQVGSAGTGNGQFGDIGPAFVYDSFGNTYFSPPFDGLAVDSNDNVYVVDVGNDRVQKFDNDLVYVTKWGTNGSGNGQFDGVVGIAINASDRIFVGDTGNGRIQEFDTSGTYVAQIAVSASIIHSLTIASSTGYLYAAVTALTYTIQSYDIDGMTGLVDSTLFTAGSGVGEFSSDGTLLGMTQDNAGDIHVTDAGNYRVHKFAESVGFVGQLDYVSTYGVYGRATGQLLHAAGLAFGPSDTIYVADPLAHHIVPFAATGSTPYTLSEVFTEYIGLCDPDGNYTISYDAASDPEVVFPGWTENVWTQLKRLCAATGTEIYYSAGTIHIDDIGSRTLDITNRDTPTVTPGALGSARSIEVVAQRATGGDGLTFYDAAADGAIYDVSAGGTTMVTVATPHSIASVNSPSPASAGSVAAGHYSVQDSTGATIPRDTWVEAGGSVTAQAGAEPGSIDITITAPAGTISGYTAPYSLASGTNGSRRAELIVTGSGVTVDPIVVTMHTGAEDDQTPTERAERIDNPFINTVGDAYDRGVWATAERLFTQTLALRIPLDSTKAFGAYAGCIVTFDNANYRVTSATVDATGVTLTCAWHTTVTAQDAAWAAESLTYDDLDTLWDGKTFRDQTVRPLLNA